MKQQLVASIDTAPCARTESLQMIRNPFVPLACSKKFWEEYAVRLHFMRFWNSAIQKNYINKTSQPSVDREVLLPNPFQFVRFEGFTPVVMKSTPFWDITPFSPLEVDRRFGGTYRLHLQDWRINRSRSQHEGKVDSDCFPVRPTLCSLAVGSIVKQNCVCFLTVRMSSFICFWSRRRALRNRLPAAVGTCVSACRW
jgi:hypothetical protein